MFTYLSQADLCELVEAEADCREELQLGGIEP
jgi:hypothetical protein